MRISLVFALQTSMDSVLQTKDETIALLKELVATYEEMLRLKDMHAAILEERISRLSQAK